MPILFPIYPEVPQYCTHEASGPSQLYIRAPNLLLHHSWTNPFHEGSVITAVEVPSTHDTAESFLSKLSTSFNQSFTNLSPYFHGFTLRPSHLNATRTNPPATLHMHPFHIETILNTAALHTCRSLNTTVGHSLSGKSAATKIFVTQPTVSP